MQETQLQHAAIVVAQSGQNPLRPLRRFIRSGTLLLRQDQVFVQLGLREPQAHAPERAQDRARGGEEVAANRARGRPLAEPRDGLHRHLLREVLGIGAVADPGVDERVHELQLVEGDVCRARRGRKLDHFAGVFIWRAWFIWATRVPGHRTGTKSRLNSASSVTRPGYWSAGLSQRSYARRQPGRPARRQTR